MKKLLMLLVTTGALSSAHARTYECTGLDGNRLESVTVNNETKVVGTVNNGNIKISLTDRTFNGGELVTLTAKYDKNLLAVTAKAGALFLTMMQEGTEPIAITCLEFKPKK